MGKEQYYIGSASAPELLVYKKYLKQAPNGQSVVVENRKYLGQLTLYFSDCPSFQQEINACSYQQNSLAKLFLTYYKCRSLEPGFHKKTDKFAFHFGVIAGVSATFLKFKGSGHDYLINATFKPSFGFAGGTFLDVILARNRGKWSICNELLYTYYYTEGEYIDFVHANRYTTHTTQLGYMYLKLNNMVRYRILIGKVAIFAGAGISNGFAFIEQNQMQVTEVFFGQSQREEKALNDTRKYEVGFVGGLGLQVGKFTGEFRYETSTGMSAYTALKSAVNRGYFLLGYRF